MERRQFFYLAGLGTSTLFAGNLLTSCSKDDNDENDPGTPSGTKKITIDLNDAAYASLAANGGSAIKDNVLIIHTTGSNYFAFSKICTHQGCTVGFNGTDIVCPCHGSKFATTGAVLQGPATSALPTYNTALSGNTLTVNLG